MSNDLPGVEVPAICDINEDNLRRAQDIVEKAGRPQPAGYSGGPEDFRRLVERKDLDAVTAVMREDGVLQYGRKTALVWGIEDGKPRRNS